MMGRLRRLVLVGVVAFLGTGAVCAAAEQAARRQEAGGKERTEVEIAGLRVGFAGRYKVGVWTPVEVMLRGTEQLTAGELSVIVPDGDGVPSRVAVPLDGGQASGLLYVRFGRTQGELRVELREGEQLVARRVFSTNARTAEDGFLPAVGAARKVILAVGADGLGVDGAIDQLRHAEGQGPVCFRLGSVEQLPSEWYGYEGIDALVLSTSAAETLGDLKADSRQIAALDEWVGMGGRLVFCVGERGNEVLKEGSAWSRFAPGRLEKMVGLRDTRAIETYASSTTAATVAVRGERPELLVPQLTDVQGAVEAREAGLDLVVRTVRGFGQILFVAADLDRGPLSQWSDRPLLMARLLDLPTGRTETLRESGAVMHYGFSDLSGQLRSALEGFRGVKLVPFWVVVALVVGYLLLIGPADYFFLRKMVRRMEWTWLTFPAVVVVVSLFAFWLAYYLKGAELRVNQIDLIDVDEVSGQVRGTSWLSVFSPRSEPRDLSLRPQPFGEWNIGESRVLFSWLGLPGSGLGGMDPGASAPMFGGQQYDFTHSLDALLGVPIQVWSTKSLTSRWTVQAKSPVRGELAEEGQELTGVITNSLDFPLTKCLLAYGDWAYRIDTLGPGESVRVGPETKQNELRTFLNDSRIVTDDRLGNYHQQSRPYDRSSVDIPYILQAAMFFEKAGGQRYTGLTNGYQGFVDMSSLLGSERAILLAWAPADRHGARLLANGEATNAEGDEHMTVYRFVLPVSRAGAKR